MKVYYTEKRFITTFHIGKFIAHCFYLYCESHKERIFVSEEINRLAPKHCNYGYDILIYCGKSLFLCHKTAQEIVPALKERNILISHSTVSLLARKFIIYLAILHKTRCLALKEHMDKKGGYILHLDGTSEGSSPHLITALDEMSHLVLDNIKIPTEKAEQMIPMLYDIKKTFGNPLAIVHDMGKAMLGSSAAVFPDVFTYICHFHFLKDIGKDLFEKDYAVIRSRLKHHGISTKLRYRIRQLNVDQNHPFNFNHILSLFQTDKLSDVIDPTICYVLIEWGLDGKKQCDGFGFPFDRPHLVFYQRLIMVDDFLDKIKRKYGHDYSKYLKPISKLSNDLQPITHDIKCQNTLPQLTKKIEIFDKLRTSMQIVLPHSNKGLNDNGNSVSIKTIKEGVTGFRNWLINSKYYDQDAGYKKMIQQIDKYWEKLFADPINVKTKTGIVTVQPQRTNNILEIFFRDIRKSYRKRTGNNKMAKFLQTMLKDMPLVKNLENPEYVKILLNGKFTLEECFVEIDTKLVRKKLKHEKICNEKIPAEIKKIVRSTESMYRIFDVIKKEND